MVQYGALFMLFFGTMGKFSAIFISVPEPVMGGVFLVMFGLYLSSIPLFILLLLNLLCWILGTSWKVLIEV